MDNVADKSTKFNKSTFLISFSIFFSLSYFFALSFLIVYILLSIPDLDIYVHPSSFHPPRPLMYSFVDIASL